MLDHSKFMFTNGSYTLAWNTLYDNNDCVVNYQVSATNCDMDMSNISVTINQHITLHREDLGTSQQPVFINITQTLRDSDHQCNDSFAYNYNYELIQIQPDTGKSITMYISLLITTPCLNCLLHNMYYIWKHCYGGCQITTIALS